MQTPNDKSKTETKVDSKADAKSRKISEDVDKGTNVPASKRPGLGVRDSQDEKHIAETLDSPEHAKGIVPDEGVKPGSDYSDVATANLSPEARRENSHEIKTEDPMIAALLRERESLAAQGKNDRVNQVDEQLQLRGYNPKEKAQQKLPQGRTSTAGGQQNTSAS